MMRRRFALKTTRTTLYLGIIAGLTFSSNSVGQAVEDVRPEEVHRLIELLGASEFEVRETASSELWKLGRQGEPALRQALKHPDREVVHRIRSILELFDYGILPGTPPEISILIDQFRSGDLNEKDNAAQQLIEKKSARTLFKLIRMEEEGRTKQLLSTHYLNNVHLSGYSVLKPLLESGNHEAIEEILKICEPTVKNDLHSVAYYDLTGTLNQYIETLELELQTEATDQKHRKLMFCYRAQGKWNEAISHANQIENGGPLMIEALLLESGDWEALSDLFWDEEEAKEIDQRALKGVEHLSYAITYHRLGNKEDRFKSDVDALRKIAQENIAKRDDCARAMIFNGLIDEGLETRKTKNLNNTFGLLTERHQYEAAFDAIKMGNTAESRKKWFNEVLDGLEKKRLSLTLEFTLAVEAAGYLNTLGLVEESNRYLDLLAEVAAKEESKKKSMLSFLVDHELRLELEDRAWEHLELALSPNNYEFPLLVLFNNDQELSKYWWWVLDQESDDLPARLKTIQRLLAEDGPDPLSDQRFEELHQLAIKYNKGSPDNETSIERFNFLAETFERSGRYAQALKYFLQFSPPSQQNSMLAIADLYRKNGQPQKAIEWYQKVRQKYPHRHIAQFMEGTLLKEIGETKRGEAMLTLTAMNPLANSTRFTLAYELEDREFEDDALRQFSVFNRVQPLTLYYSFHTRSSKSIANAELRSAFVSVNSYTSQLRIGNFLRDIAPLDAALAWNRALLMYMRAGTSLRIATDYWSLPNLIAYAHADGYFREGKYEQGLRSIAFSNRLRPGSSQLAEDFVPLLEKAGLQADADRVFQSVKEAHLKTLEKFPNSALHLNNLAWFSARCGRDYSESLALSQKAVNLQPNNVNYIDTLGEIHFRLGNREQAIDLARLCIKKDPGKKHYHEQLARFTKEDSIEE